MTQMSSSCLTQQHQQQERTQHHGLPVGLTPKRPTGTLSRRKVITNGGFAVLGAVVLGLLLYFGAHQQQAVPTWSELELAREIHAQKSGQKSNIETGEVENVAYYYCMDATADQPKDKGDVILLHGSAFTKEHWKRSGILGDLCLLTTSSSKNSKGSIHAGRVLTSITALDLGVKAPHTDLQRILQALESQGKISLPVAAVVTPSASGSTILDWLTQDDPAAMRQFWARWIPIATYAALNTDPKVLETLKLPPPASSLDQQQEDLGHDPAFPILALYGERDKKGKASADYLTQYAGATQVAVDGGHACYLDSPHAFVVILTEYLASELQPHAR